MDNEAKLNISLAKEIASHLGLPWHDTKHPDDAVCINAAYAALESLKQDGVSLPKRR